MKNKTMVAGLMVLIILAGVMISSRVDGDACVPGIKKEHLDATTGAFVDNSTIEISTSGVRVKPDYINGKLGQSVKSAVTNVISTNSTSFLDMTGMSLTITTRGGNVLIMFSTQVDNSNNETLFQLLRGSNVLISSGTGHTTQGKGSDNVSFQCLDTVSAGTYTYKIQWRTTAGTSYTRDNVLQTAQTRSFIIMELPF